VIRPIVFGKFCLLERISVGGMAEIYRAKLLNAPQFKRFMAIKRVLPSLVADNEFITMFIDEARISVELNHPNICQIYELGRLNDAHYMVMEYIPGHDLLSIQKYYRSQRKIMSVSQACFIIAQVAQGLDFAHRATDRTGQPLGIVHRDISPQNVLVSYEGLVKLIDFGVAKAASKNSKTQAGVLKGKFGYMSPEQADAAQNIDNRSDLFGLGTVFWELLTGRRLFYDENDYVTLEKVRNCAVPPPSGYNHLVPPQVDAIVMKALQREARDRYGSGGQMAQDLWAFIGTGNPPYTQNHLQHWMCAAFADDLKREWEKIGVFESLNTAQDIQRYNAENDWSDQGGETIDFEGNVVQPLSSSDGSKPEITQVFTPQFDYSKIKGDAVDAMPKQGESPAGMNNPMHMSQFEIAALKTGGKGGKSKVGMIALVGVLLLAVAGIVVAVVLVLEEEEGGGVVGSSQGAGSADASAQGGGADAEAKGSLTLTIQPTGDKAEVELYQGDVVVGQSVGEKATFDKLKPGTYRAVITHPLYQKVEVIQVINDQTATKAVELTERKTQTARVQITPERAEVQVTGQEKMTGAQVNEKGLKLTLGQAYEVEVKALGYRTARFQVSPDKEGEQTLPPVTLEPGVGTLSVTLNKRADLTLTGLRTQEERKFESTESVVIPNLDATQGYRLEIKRSGYSPWSEEISGFDEAKGFQEARAVELKRD
jgi:serine/threonine protein kinase